MKLFIPTLALAATLFAACGRNNSADRKMLSNDIARCTAQLTRQTDIIEASGEVLIPRTADSRGEIEYVPIDDWTSGFFAGCVWYEYRLTGQPKWLPLAEKYTVHLDSVKYLSWHHDVGFMIGASYLTGYRTTGDSRYRDVIVEAARSLSTRFRPVAGIIQSWNVDRGWQSQRGWECPVIIDNMMNLELLFEASLFSGDDSFRRIAVSHADRTLENHFRPDGSSYHVVDYSLADGTVRRRCTAQGYADSSAWARGQAWALYGYTMCYRYTRDSRYLAQAEKVYDFIFSNPDLPADAVPYWDFDAPDKPTASRDASAAACIASALYELSLYSSRNDYAASADRILRSLSSPAYLAAEGSNGNFILMHSVGSIPHGQEIDVPLNYADYYFMEAMWRKEQILNGKSFLPEGER